MSDATPHEPPVPMIPEQEVALLRESLHKYRIPTHMHESVIAYVVHGRLPGNFLRAVLSNDLQDAVFLANHANRAALANYVKVLYWAVPASCWGSPEAVTRWLSRAARRVSDHRDSGTRCES